LRIVIVSNLYPPHYIGGYELACRDIVDGLRSRGHQICVVTSSFGTENARVDDDAHRVLELALDFATGTTANRTKDILAIEWNNQSKFRKLLKEFNPDIVFYWNMRGFSLSLVSVSQALGLPSCFYVSDDWLASWTEQNDYWFGFWSRTPRFTLSKAAKPLCERALQILRIHTRPTNLEQCHFAFASRHMLDTTHHSGKALSNSVVIYHGVDVTNIVIKQRHDADIHRLLYVGRLVPDKGAHTAVEAFHILRSNWGHMSITLDIVGTGPDNEYLERLRSMIRDYRLQDNVEFLGFARRNTLQQIYNAHDVFIFPSVWEEPFSIVLLDVMASGLPVVSTATGGTPEILVDNENSLIFERGNAHACAEQLHRLLVDPNLADQLRMNSRRTVEASFTFEMMLDQIEQLLLGIVSGTEH